MGATADPPVNGRLGAGWSDGLSGPTGLFMNGLVNGRMDGLWEKTGHSLVVGGVKCAAYLRRRTGQKAVPRKAHWCRTDWTDRVDRDD